MPDRYTDEEKEWLKEVCKDFARWRAQKGDAAPFLEAARDSWLRAFPFRHPCLCEHVPHTKEEDDCETYGKEYWGLVEVGLTWALSHEGLPL
jgi:hypothetical protein